MQHLQLLCLICFLCRVLCNSDVACENLVFTRKLDSNAPELSLCFCMCRLTGRAIFCRKLLSARGILIEVPREESDQGVDVLAAYLAPRLDAATEGTLATYYM